MDPRHIPPTLKLQWTEEVLYLHSLWHIGPPQNPNPSPSTSPSPSPIPSLNLHPINSSQFSKPRKRKRGKKRKNRSKAINQPTKAPEIEWPFNLSPDRSAELDDWTDPTPNPHARQPPSAEEQARASALQVQKAVVKSCREFFAGSDDDEEAENEDGAELEAFKFFSDIFMNDEDLRGYYVKCNGKGEFLCLVCIGAGVKLGKRYRDCVGLVQHAISVVKTRRKGAHKGFGRVVCEVLGWDFSRLPNIILDRTAPLGQSLVKEDEMQEDLLQEDSLGEVAEISAKGEADEEEKELLKQPESDDKNKHQICSPSNTPAGKIVLPCEGIWSTKPDAIGWENLILPPDDTQPRQPSEEDQERVAALQVQKNALMACRDFLAKSDGSSSSDEDMNDVEIDKCGSLALNFFLMLFTKNSDLRNYYERNCSKGEFVCWVCWGIDKETWKRFGDCLGLVQHSKSINSTKRKWAHLAFAKAVCQVLGWNVDGSPSMALPPEECQAQNPEKSAKTQSDASNDDSADFQDETAACGN